ncbi:MAG TPA: efflux RND transporter permease subunit, partial [Actinomycetota bacterium]|nr:efflux RND transporter permease subunit [Actinomycetota bacterium]
LVDDAVVDVDVLARRLGRHRAEARGHPVWRTIIDASMESRTAMLHASLIIIAALVAAYFTEGTAGAFLPSIALSFVLALAASTVVALTVTPVLGMMLLSKGPLERRSSPVGAYLRGAYDRVAHRLVRGPAPAFAAFGVLAVVGLVALPFLRTSLRPSLHERDVLVQIEAPPGTSLQRTDQLVAETVDDLVALPGVRDVGAHVGRAVTSDQVVNVNAGEVWVSVDPSADYGETIADIENVVGRHDELSSDVLTYSEKRVTDVLQRSDDGIVVRLYGEDPEALGDKAEEIRGLLSRIEGIDRTRVDIPANESAIQIEVDLQRAERFGAKPGDVRRAAAALLSGITVGNLFEEQKVFDVVVWGTPELRESVGDIQNMLIDTPGGLQVPLGAVADVRIVPNLAVIRHESVERYLDVTAGVTGRDAGAVAADVERAIEKVEFPLDHHAELLGGVSGEGTGGSRALAVGLAGVIAAFLLLQTAFKSWRLAILAFVALPVALVGGEVAALLDGRTVSLGSIAGFLAVLAVAARGTVLLIRHYQHLERGEGRAFDAELVVTGTRDRVAAVVLGALATAAVLLPFVVLGTVAGLEIVRPMAIVILGGLVTSTVLQLVIVPPLYLRYGFVAEPDRSAEELEETVTIPETEPVAPPGDDG